MVAVPAEIAEAWNLGEGSAVELSPLSEAVPAERTIRYASVEEALTAFRETLPLHEEAYRELAK